MMHLLLVLALLVASFVSASDLQERRSVLDELEDANGVLALSDDDFDRLVIEEDTFLVEFYAPWCGHCKSFAPTYDKLGQYFQQVDDVRVAKVDATQNKALAQRFEIRGYPTLLLLKDGAVVPFRGDRSFQSVVDFVRDVEATSLAHVDDVSALMKEGTLKATFVLFTKKEDKVPRQVLAQARELQQVADFLWTDSERVLQQMGCSETLSEHSLVALHSAHCAHAQSHIEEFVRENLFPEIAELTSQSLPLMARQYESVYILAATRSSWPRFVPRLRRAMAQVAVPSETLVTVADARELRHWLARTFAVQVSPRGPTLVWLHLDLGQFATAPIYATVGDTSSTRQSGGAVAPITETEDFAQFILSVEAGQPPRWGMPWWSPTLLLRQLQAFLRKHVTAGVLTGVLATLVATALLFGLRCLYSLAKDLGEFDDVSDKKNKGTAVGQNESNSAKRNSKKQRHVRRQRQR